MYMIASTHVSYHLDITQDPSRAANTTVTPKLLLKWNTIIHLNEILGNNIYKGFSKELKRILHFLGHF